MDALHNIDVRLPHAKYLRSFPEEAREAGRQSLFRHADSIFCTELGNVYTKCPRQVLQDVKRRMLLPDYLAPVLLSGGLAGALLDRERAPSRTSVLLEAALGIVLVAALWRWAMVKKRRLLAIVLGAALFGGAAFMLLVWYVLTGKRGRKDT